ILQASGVKVGDEPQHKLDGIDLLPIIRRRDTQAAFERTLFWRHLDKSAMRSGRWKYLHDGKEEHLFDLGTDERENAEFQQTHPREFERLRAEFAKWEQGVLPRKLRPNYD
ncbi:MAG: hypothetical protein LC747_06395, partial [Acidobacteria bacterium]|nr:hypothetical protein [Acidobacteriota bacterium]